VLARRRLGPVGVARVHGVEDGGVLDVDLPGPALHLEGGARHEEQGIGHLGQRPVHVAVMGRVADPGVELAVDDRVPLVVALVDAPAFLEQVAQGGELRLGGVLGREPGRGALQELAQGIELDDLLLVELGHREAAHRVDREQPLGDQPVHGLAHRGAADLGHVRDLGLADALARHEDAAADQLLEADIDELRPRDRGILQVRCELVHESV
jgi:hypothetical protein